jgi:hypothetical protein
MIPPESFVSSRLGGKKFTTKTPRRAKNREALYWLRRCTEGIINRIPRERLEFRL